MRKIKVTKCFFKLEVKAKILLFSLFFVFFSGFANDVESQNMLHFNFKNANVKKVIDYIETNSDFRFLYKSSEVNLDRKVTLNYKGKVAEVVTILFNKTNVQPVIVNKQVVLKPKTKLQKRVVSGKVVDMDGIPLEGVTILINKFERGTATDADGKYSISAKKGDEMLFTYIGFKEHKVVLSDEKVVNVTLEEDVAFLDEVVLVGYGRKEKSKISTAISTIEGEDIQDDLQSGGSFDRSLGGMVKGLKVTQGGGKPGSGVDINIRGYTSPFSNSANNPLFVIDGVPIQVKKALAGGAEYNPLTSINPNDIESVNVLKDAAATAIYGSRGANGVIIVKTKKGDKVSGLTVDLSVRSTFSKPINTLKYLDAEGYKGYVDALMKGIVQYENSLTAGSEEHLSLRRTIQGYTNFGVSFFGPKATYSSETAKFGKGNTNWSDVVYRKAAYTKEYNASVRGSLDNLNYGLSFRFLNQEGLLKADEFEQYNTRLNLSFSPNEKWELGTNVSLGLTENNTGYVSMHNDVNGLLSVRPDLEVYDKKGKFTTYEKSGGAFGNVFIQDIVNPLGQTTKHLGKVKGKTATGNMYVQYEVLSGLKLKAALNVAHFQSDGERFNDRLYSSIGTFKLNPMFAFPGSEVFLAEVNKDLSSTLAMTNSADTNVVLDFTANYEKTFNEKHGVDILAGVTRTREYEESTRNEYRGFDLASLKFPQYAKHTDRSVKNRAENGLNSYIGRVMYDYNNKYNLAATIRLDQSSKFSPSNRDAWFPSVSASWNVHNEKFMDLEKINQLKLRLSYGNTGSTNVPSFTFIQKFNAKSNYNGQTSTGLSQQLANPKAGWEKTSEVNIGLDFGFVRNRISGSVDVYKRRTTGALMPTPHNLDTGTSEFTANFATIDNKGIELDLNFSVIDTEKIYWSLGFNATKNINKLISFDASSIDEGSLNNYEIGKEINLIKGYVVEGIYQTAEEVKKDDDTAKAKGHKRYDESALTATFPGDYKYKDISGPNGKPDGKITRGHDLKILGSSQPDLFGGFRTRFDYNGISLGASFNYSLGAEATRYRSTQEGDPFVNIEEQYAPKYRWSPENKGATLPRIGIRTNNGSTSSANVYDASFLRLKSVRLGYNLPFSVLEQLRIKSVSFYISGNNLYTWTKFPGLDPEATAGGAFTHSTRNTDPYPISKSWTLGLNVKF